jgi:hypothetical protein
MELLEGVGLVESHFGLFRDSVSVGARYVHVLRQTYHMLRNHFGRTRWYSNVTRLNWRLVWVCLEILLILTQDKLMACAECTIRLRNRFGCTQWNTYVTWVMWNLVSVCLETVLVSVLDRCTVCAKHTIGSEIILDAPDCTPRWQGSIGSLFGSIWR